MRSMSLPPAVVRAITTTRATVVPRTPAQTNAAASVPGWDRCRRVVPRRPSGPRSIRAGARAEAERDDLEDQQEEEDDEQHAEDAAGPVAPAAAVGVDRRRAHQ